MPLKPPETTEQLIRELEQPYEAPLTDVETYCNASESSGKPRETHLRACEALKLIGNLLKLIETALHASETAVKLFEEPVNPFKIR